VDGALPGNVKELLQNDWQAGELALLPEAYRAGVLEAANKAARPKVAIA